MKKKLSLDASDMYIYSKLDKFKNAIFKLKKLLFKKKIISLSDGIFEIAKVYTSCSPFTIGDPLIGRPLII